MAATRVTPTFTTPPQPRGHGRRLAAAAMRYGVPLAVTAGLCWLLMHGQGVAEMLPVLTGECRWGWIALNALLLIAAMVARALRWRLQLKALGVGAGVWALTLSIFGTYAVNLVFPRLGELWRTSWIAQRQRAPFATVFGSMVADRLTDTVAVGLFTLAAMAACGPQVSAYLALNPQLATRFTALLASPWLWGGIAAVTVIAAAVAAACRGTAAMAALRRMAGGLWQGFAVLAAMKGKWAWLAYTLIIWACYFGGLACAFEAFPLTARVLSAGGATALLLCFVLTSLSMLVPSNGGIGPWQWAMVWGLGLYAAAVPGLSQPYMIAFANLALGVQTSLSILLGLLTFGCIALDNRHHRNS